MQLSKALKFLGVSRNKWLSYYKRFESTNINFIQYLDLFYEIKHPYKIDYSEYKVVYGFDISNFKYAEKRPINIRIDIQEREIRIGMIFKYQCINGVKTLFIVGPHADKEYTYEIDTIDIEKFILKLVIYVVSKDNPDKIEAIYNIEQFEQIEKKYHNYKMPNGNSIPIEFWDSMKKNKYIIGYDRVSYTTIYMIYIPIKIDNGCITYYESVLFEKEVLDIYNAYKALSLIPELEYYVDYNWLYEDCQKQSRDIFNTKVQEIDKYVNTFDIKKVLSSYKIRRWGHLQSRPGKDDTYYSGIDRSINSMDNYIKSLLKIDDEELHYETAYRLYDKDFDYFDEEQLDEEIKMAMSQYDKKKHFMYLLKQEVDSIVEFATYKARLIDRLIMRYNKYFPLGYRLYMGGVF